MAKKVKTKPRYVQGELFPEYSVENYAATMGGAVVNDREKKQRKNAKISNSK
jgi:hypothetical protein